MTGSEQERQLRWQKHFGTLHNGRVVEGLTGPTTRSCQMMKTSRFKISPEMTAKSIRKLGNNAVGRDGIAAPLLKAGGDPLATKLHALENDIVEQEKIAAMWKGGRLVDVYKMATLAGS